MAEHLLDAVLVTRDLDYSLPFHERAVQARFSGVADDDAMTHRGRTRHFTRIVATAAALAFVVVSCGGDDDSNAGDAAGTTISTRGNATFDLPQGDEPFPLDPATFTPDIDNPYWPMKPGTRWTYREIDETGEVVDVVVVVTTETKRIANGVTARVVRDTVSQDGEIIEDTFDWYAQDDAGNVWYLGEDTAEFEDGKVSSREGSWEAGVDGALAGVALPGNPQDGMQYRQEYYAGEAEDNGEVLSTEEMAEVPYGQFDGVLLTKDTIATEPDVLEYKLYAKDVGPVLVFGVSGGGGREELVKVDQAPADAGTGPLGTPNP